MRRDNVVQEKSYKFAPLMKISLCNGRKKLILQCFFKLILLPMFLLPLFLHTAIAADKQQKVWLFKGDSISVPLKQNIGWKVPACDIPNAFIDAVKTVFKQGFADPRGCEYREVTILMCNDAWGGFCRRKTHGWVLPETTKNTQRFAVLWNGLVYPVISVGGKAFLKDDVQRLIKYNIQRNKISKNNLTIPENKRLKRPKIFSSGIIMYHRHNYFPMCALLLRLGDGKLAEDVYRTSTSTRNRHSLEYLIKHINFDYKWALFSRALAAAMYGDDKLALCYAKQFEPLIKNDNSKFGLTARKLFEDQLRRAREKLHPLPAPKNKIDTLIQDLENVNKRQCGQPGGVTLGNDKRVKALIEIGDPAIEALLQCLENDIRLTRSVSFGRDFCPQRTIITVGDAAYVALSGILQQSFFFTGAIADNVSNRDLEYRKKLAQKIRKHYNRYKKMTYEEKWYNILKNNDETVKAQLQAAANICRKSNVKVIPNSSGALVTRIGHNGKEAGLKGEILRTKANPSVSELLNKRAVEYLPDESKIASSWAFHYAQKMALYSSIWELRNSLRALQKVSDEIYRALPKYEMYKSTRFKLLIPLTVQRFKAGDKPALTQYCRALQSNPKAVLGKPPYGKAWERCLEPLYTNPDEKDSKVTAEIILNTPGSGWSKYFGKFKDARRINSYYRGLFAELMRLSSYRKHVLNGLDNKNEIIKWRTTIIANRGDFRYEYLDHSGSGSRGFDINEVKKDPRFPGINII